MLTVQVTDQTTGIRRYLRSLASAFDDGGARQVAGRASANTVAGHLRKLDRTRANAMGGKRSHFYADAAAATFFAVVSDGIEVHVAKEGMAQRYYGGTIEPSGRTSDVTGKPIKSLAIPATAEAYGRGPGDFDDLVFMQSRSGGTAMLARQTLDGAHEILFWLVKSVTQEGDTSVLPSERLIAHNALTAVNAYLDRKLKKVGL